MTRQLALVVAATCVIAAVTGDVQGTGAAPARGPAAVAPDRQVLGEYCFTCHNEKVRSGGLALSTLDLASVSTNADVWEKVVRKVRTGAMPPVGRARPDKAVAAQLVTWLEAELDRAASEHPNPGRPSLQRLNRSEYRNAVRDLLAVEIDAASMLPADVAGYGFDNNADALTLSSALTERYLGAAAKISQMALARPRGVPAPETFLVPTDRDQAVRVSDDLPFGSRGGLAVRHYFPADGEYRFELRPKENGVAGGFEGITDEPHQLEVSLDNVTVWTGTVGGPEFVPDRGGNAGGDGGAAEEERDRRLLELLKVRVPVKAGSHLVQVYFAAKTSAVRRRPVRPILATRALPSRWRRATTIRADDQRPSAGHGRSRGYPEPAPAVGLHPCPRARRGVRDEDHLDAGAACVPAPANRRRSPGAARLISRRRGPSRVRGGHRDGYSQHPREPQVSVSLRESAGGGCGQRALSHQRSRFGIAPVVLPLEQHPR